MTIGWIWTPSDYWLLRYGGDRVWSIRSSSREKARPGLEEAQLQFNIVFGGETLPTNLEFYLNLFSITAAAVARIHAIDFRRCVRNNIDD